MTWCLFLDDERFPDNLEKWVIARSVHEARELIKEFGCPSIISFDHDLGDSKPTGKDFANWLVETDISSHQNFIPKDFSFEVHSQNPVGGKNIQLYLVQYLTKRFGGFE